MKLEYIWVNSNNHYFLMSHLANNLSFRSVAIQIENTSSEREERIFFGQIEAFESQDYAQIEYEVVNRHGA